MRPFLAILFLAVAVTLARGEAELFDPWAPEDFRRERRAPAYVETGNPVVDWNRLLLDSIRARREWPPQAARALAMMHLAIFDSVNSIEPHWQPYALQADGYSTASMEAAIACSAHDVATAVFPMLAVHYDDALTSALAAVPDGDAKAAGIQVGQQCAAAIIALRTGDGSSSTTLYLGDTNPGQWRPTRPAFRTGLAPHWGTVTCFAIDSATQFRPPPPPALASADYLDDYNDVMEFGEFFSETRTEEQTEIALFWADNPGTFVPPGHWNQIAGDVVIEHTITVQRAAHLFALLNLAQADAAISCWEAKYHYSFWRPITAINLGASDGNNDTVGDPDWTPVLITPPFPEYPSGHAMFSGAAAEILTALVGEEVAFTGASDNLPENFGVPDVVRSFASFHAAAEEAARSRIYGGIHFRSADHEGLESGRALGGFILENRLLPVPANQAWSIR